MTTYVSRLAATIVGITILSPASAWAQPCGSNGQARCDFGSAPNFDEREFGDAVADLFDGARVKGWSLSLVDPDGHEVLRASQGVANSSTQQPFYGTTVSGIGSVSKMFTDAAVRHATELNQALPNAECADSFTLDTPFLEALPSVFSEIAHSDYDNVTIRQILQHEGGVPETENNGPEVPPHWYRKYTYYDTMRKIDVKADGWCQKGVDCYNNDNYVLATMMLPIIQDCNYIDWVDAWSNAACATISGARDRAECEIQVAWDTLGPISNAIVEDWILDPLEIEGTCEPIAEPVVNGQNVALAYESVSDSSGALPRAHERSCNVGRRFMSSQDLARAMRYLRGGSFFLNRSNAAALPERHLGVLDDESTSGQRIVYSAYYEDLDDGFVVAMETNQAYALDSDEVPAMDDWVRAAFRNARGGSEAVPQTFLSSIRGDWTCDKSGVGADVLFQSYGRMDNRIFFAEDQAGTGAKEIWITRTNGSSSAEGFYNYYEASGSPIEDSDGTGTWLLNRATSTRLDLTRRDVRGWTGTYSCTRR